MSKRIVIYGINYDPEPIGVGRYTGDLGRYLAGRGHDVRVVTAPPHYPGWTVAPPYRAGRYARDRQAGVRILRCPLLLRDGARGLWRLLIPASFALSSAPVAIWTILRHRPDVVLCVEPTLLSAPAALLAAKLVGARTVLHVQDLEIDAAFAVGHLGGGALGRLARAFERVTLARFDRIVTISDEMRRRLGAKGVPAATLAIVRNWVDIAKIRPLAGPNPYRQELGLAADDFVVLYSGNIGVKQALPVVLDAAARLEDDPRIVFVIGGEGPEKARLVSAYGGLRNVRFVPLQPEERLAEFLNLADLHVLPQGAGAADLVLPSKLGGALASGKRILATANDGTELHGFLRGVGRLVPAGDVDAVTAAIRDAAAERSHDPEPALALARTLSAPESLARFERLLLSAEP
jgi:colanic acid biosynthesis glycosyl transferase WcaI